MNGILLTLLGSLAVGCLGFPRGGYGGQGHNHHHYYSEVTNNVHHHHDDDHHGDDDDHHDGEHRYRFHIGDSNLGAYAYLDSNGHIQGVYIDFLKSVCKRAGKKCHYMLDDFSRCWDTKGENEKPGTGLLFGAYDGCLGMLKTPERVNSFDFTRAFSPAPKPRLIFKKGGVRKDPTDITGMKIGFVHAWALNPKCLSRSGSFQGEFESKFYDTHEALIKGVATGEVYAGVSASAFAAEEKLEGVEYDGPVFKCGVSGLSVMTHYGSDVQSWWNKAVDSLVSEFGWKKLCDTAKAAHGEHGDIFCVE